MWILIVIDTVTSLRGMEQAQVIHVQLGRQSLRAGVVPAVAQRVWDQDQVPLHSDTAVVIGFTIEIVEQKSCMVWEHSS